MILNEKTLIPLSVVMMVASVTYYIAKVEAKAINTEVAQKEDRVKIELLMSTVTDLKTNTEVIKNIMLENQRRGK